MRDKVVVGAEHLDGLEYCEPQKLEAAFLELCYFGVGTCINDDIGHDIVGLEIIQWNDHPAGRCSRRGCDRGERGDGRIARVHRHIGSIRAGAAKNGIFLILGRLRDV